MKIIASDYDGTVNYNGISEDDRDAIAKFRKAGNKFGIVTGRDLELALWVLYDLKKCKTEVDFVICCTGAIILTGEGKIARIKPGKVTEKFHEVIKLASECGVGTFNMNYKLKKVFVDPQGRIPYSLDDLPEFTQMNLWFENGDDAIKFNEIMQNYKDIISSYQNGKSVDMPPPSTSKVTGIYDYAEQFDSPEIYVVGDNLNDIPMIKDFCSFAVSNAHPRVKELANYQCDRIADMIDFIMEEK